MQLFSHVLLLQLKACSASGSNQISRGLFHLDSTTTLGSIYAPGQRRSRDRRERQGQTVLFEDLELSLPPVRQTARCTAKTFLSTESSVKGNVSFLLEVYFCQQQLFHCQPNWEFNSDMI